jgi:hypothetical protein
MAGQIATRGCRPDPAGPTVGVERSHAWLNRFGKLRWRIERRRACVAFWLAPACVVAIIPTVWSAKRGPSTAGMSALTADHDIRRPATYDPAAANSRQSAAAHPTSAWRSASVKVSRSALSTSSVPTTVPVPGSTTGTIASDSVLVNAVR